MSLPRFYVDTPLQVNQSVQLPDSVAHHAGRVLRLRAGDEIVLFNGSGGQYHAKLQFENKQVVVTPHSFCQPQTELSGRITLLQGIAAGDKMDWIIEKAVEMGVQQVIPLQTERSVLKLSGDRLDKRLLHWRKTAQAAAEQSGRNCLTEISAPCSLVHALQTPNTDLRLFCHPSAELTFSAAIPLSTQAVQVFIGPEGGWSQNELQSADQAGLVKVLFGARVLRTETAGIALIAAISTRLNWI